MSLYGAVRENTRRNESLDRGTVSVTGSATVTVTGTPGPIRQVTVAMAGLVSTAAPADYIVSVGNVGSGGGNNAVQFTIYTWKQQGTTASPPAASAISVTASPFTYTATDRGEVALMTGAATLTSFSITRGAYGPQNLVLPAANLANLTHVEKGDVLILTYSAGSPTMELLPYSAGGTLIAATDTVTCWWEAWGNLSAGQGF